MSRIIEALRIQTRVIRSPREHYRAFAERASTLTEEELSRELRKHAHPNRDAIRNTVLGFGAWVGTAQVLPPLMTAISGPPAYAAICAVGPTGSIVKETEQRILLEELETRRQAGSQPTHSRVNNS